MVPEECMRNLRTSVCKCNHHLETRAYKVKLYHYASSNKCKILMNMGIFIKNNSCRQSPGEINFERSFTFLP